MSLTVYFKDTVMKRLRRDPAFARALLCQGIETLLSNEPEVSKDLLRDYINGTIGFDGLSKQVDIPVKSLMRMLGPGGNPQANNLFAIVAALQKHAGVQIRVTSTPVKKAAKTARKAKAAESGNHEYRAPSYESARGFAEAGAKFKR